jgi:hypothetical protein
MIISYVIIMIRNNLPKVKGTSAFRMSNKDANLVLRSGKMTLRKADLNRDLPHIGVILAKEKKKVREEEEIELSWYGNRMCKDLGQEGRMEE